MQTGSNWDKSISSNNNLFFGEAWRIANRTGSTTINNAAAYSGYRLNFENIIVGANQTFTLQGSAITLFDFGGQSPAVINSSNVNQIINVPLVFSSGNTGASLVQVNGATGGNLTFGGTLSLNSNSNGNQLRISGANANTVTFGGIISATGVNEVVVSQGISAITVVYNAANTYSGNTFVESGTLQFGTALSSAGSANSSVLRLGQNTADSPAATINLATTAGGVNVGSTIVIRPSLSGTQGTRTLSSSNTSGTNTFSGTVALDAVATFISTNAGGTLAFTGPALELKTFGLLVNGAGNTTISNVISSTGTGNQLTKSGAGTLTLFAANTYTGGTTVSVGTLLANNTTGSATGSGTVAVSSGAILGGSGIISGATTISINGIHTAGDAVRLANSLGTGTISKETFTTGITYNAGSIFEWNLKGNTETSIGTRGINYDAVNTGALATTGAGAIFRVVLNAGQNFSETFWDTNRTWTDIFTNVGGTASTSIASIFGGGIEYRNASGMLTGVPSAEGSFTLSGTSLNWTAVPEPSSALAGLLLATGLLRRRRA